MRERAIEFPWRRIAALKAWVSRLAASLEGLSAEQVALLLSVGLVLGVFPIMGCPTVLCLLAAFGLRLNLAALQLLNNISSPLQLALLLPLARAGEKLCGGAMLADASWTGKAGSLALHAVTGWACICVPLGSILYVSLVFVARRIPGKRADRGAGHRFSWPALPRCGAAIWLRIRAFPSFAALPRALTCRSSES
jgi:hypothetical protein